MTDVGTYCDNTYKRLVGLKAGLYDVMTTADRIKDGTHGKAARNLSALVDSIEAGIEELKDQCPPDWTPNRRDLDKKMAELSETLEQMAEKVGVRVPDTTAWI
jgi:hypothetical protein